MVAYCVRSAVQWRMDRVSTLQLLLLQLSIRVDETSRLSRGAAALGITQPTSGPVRRLTGRWSDMASFAVNARSPTFSGHSA